MADKIQADLAKLDEEQVKMLKELCIQVNEQDEPIGPRSKVDLHVWDNIISGEKLLHRAFSVFLINKENKLLLQQRAGSKITFPDYWANTCCSHPWHTEDEMERTNDLGVKRAAIRKLKQELGITNDQVPIDDFEFVTRIHYSAPCDDGKWGEHEIDHVLILRPKNDVIVKPNPNEVQAIKWVSADELQTMFNNKNKNNSVNINNNEKKKKNETDEGDNVSAIKIAPWFELISTTFLIPKWWNNLDNITEMRDDEIHKLEL